jgi:DNA-binding MarR family transcriptional regulator
VTLRIQATLEDAFRGRDPCYAHWAEPVAAPAAASDGSPRALVKPAPTGQRAVSRRDGRVWNAETVSRALPFDPIEEAGRQWRRHWGAASAPPMSAVTSIMRAHQILIARLNDALEPYKLSFARYEALMLLFLSRRGSLPLGKMGARLQVHPASVTNLIDGLEQLGYATRAPHPTDRRTTLAAITARGREVAGEATAALNELRFGTAPLRRQDLVALTEVLQRLREGAGDFTPGL